MSDNERQKWLVTFQRLNGEKSGSESRQVIRVNAPTHSAAETIAWVQLFRLYRLTTKSDWFVYSAVEG